VKTLSICVPTYRRPELLERCVRSAIASAHDCPIEIVVADDSVSDVNVATMQRLTAEFPFVRWFRNERNLGIDDNIQHAVELAESDYVWLIGEDDTFLPGAIARVHRRIQDDDACFLFANYRFVDIDPRVVLGVATSEQLPATMTRGEFIADQLWAIGFIGACIVRKSEWASTDPAPYRGTYFTHVGRIAEILSQHSTVAIEAEPCVANRVEGGDTFTWKNDSYGVFAGFLLMCKQVAVRVPALADLMTRAAKRFEHRFRVLSLRVAARLRSDRAFDKRQFDKYLRHHPGLGATKRLAMFLISITPPQLFRPLVAFHRRVLR
jgi:glycosyltransferase involved in cell wall biosynthesis